jgi:hypothetical protein
VKRRFILALAACLLGLAATALALELGLHFLPVNELLLSQPVDESHPILTYAANRTCTWSQGGDFFLVNQVHSNNYGFISPEDFDPHAPLPLVAVVGDSYVEALMVPETQTLTARLARKLAGRARVYGFGHSGAALSDYVAYAGWVAREFHPRKFIINVVANDFDESLSAYKSAPGYHAYAPGPDGILRLTRRDYRPGLGVRLVTHSKLLMYLLTNVHATALPARLQQLLAGRSAYVGQTLADADPQRVQDSLAAVDATLRDLPRVTGLPPADICFVLDGLRPNLYDPESLRAAKDSFAGRMLQAFADKARVAGFALVDLEPEFIAGHKATGEQYEPPRDGHWNAAGHAVAARAVQGSGFLDEFGGRP